MDDALPLWIIAAACAAIAAFAGWRGARPPNLMKGPRLIPWRLIMVTGALAAILLIAQAERMSGIVLPGR